MKKGDDMTWLTQITMGSLFDGIGGFPLAAVRSGITPIWASEIEAFPIEVTKLRFPDMAHVGDITKLNGAELPPVDIICGGSPCQDLSVAGARAGLAGARSGLFMEQMRIVREMRLAEKARGQEGVNIRPRWMCWENVPGAFSSGTPKYEDFRIVMEEIVRICFPNELIPSPYPYGWPDAGELTAGGAFSLAWRCLDAQFWGVAQRRKRIFLLADFAGLPKGYLSKKTIGGKVYYYHQWSENGVKQSRYLHDSEIAPLADKIEKRKELQAQLRMLKSQKSRRNEATGMKCTFMHKRTPVAELELDDVTGFIQKIGSVYAPEHLPIGIPVRNEIADRAAFNDWWRDRSIPASRSGVREALESLGVADTKMLLVRCYGLSLSDQYWICPEGAELRWEDINFFQNDFSEDIGDVLFGERKKKDALNFSSPDSTSDGNLKKRWKIIDGKRCLIKGGSNPFRQQPFNEVIASGIMERLGIPHVSYTVIWSKDAPYSVCEDFVTENTELIPAWRLLQAKKQKNSASRYRHLLECCELLGIGNITPFLDRMLVLDYIIANEDRHFNNFGALRNAETLEWLGMAPIYDSGSSLGYDKMPGQMRSEKDVICKPFKNHHAEQLKLVTDFDWIDFDRLSDVDELISSVLSCEEAADYIDEGRIHAITESVQRRIGHLQELAMTQTPRQLDTTEDDVREEVAADYAPKMEL